MALIAWISEQYSAFRKYMESSYDEFRAYAQETDFFDYSRWR